jgi:hypothetical protein
MRECDTDSVTIFWSGIPRFGASRGTTWVRRPGRQRWRLQQSNDLQMPLSHAMTGVGALLSPAAKPPQLTAAARCGIKNPQQLDQPSPTKDSTSTAMPEGAVPQLPRDAKETLEHLIYHIRDNVTWTVFRPRHLWAHLGPEWAPPRSSPPQSLPADLAQISPLIVNRYIVVEVDHTPPPPYSRSRPTTIN